MNHPDQDMIDMIAKATPDTPVNENHRDALRRQVLDAYDQRDAGNEPTRNPLFKITGATAMKLAASFALLAAIGIFAVTTLTPSKAIAFEDVAQEILKVETASFEFAQTLIYPDGRELDLLSSKMLIKRPDMMRSEMAGMTVIVDVGKDKMLMLYTENKVAMLIDGISSQINNDKGDGMFFGDIQDHLRRAEKGNNLDDIKYDKLGEKQIDGRNAIGFHVKGVEAPKEKQGAEAPATAMLQPFDVWADIETGLIVRLVFKSPGAGGSTVTTTYKNFKYNQELDAKLFLLQAPEGYQLVDAKQGALAEVSVPEDRQGTLQLLLDGIRAHAAQNNGTFPDTLSAQFIKDRMTEQWKERYPDKPVYKNEDQREYTEPMLGNFHAIIDEAFAFIRQLEADGVSYTYAGKGVKLGDGKTPILWFKAKDAENYTVVYGDMQIKQEEQSPSKP